MTETAGPALLPHPPGFPFEGPGGLEGAAMRAFAAALQLQGHALEPVTDFWIAGGDSLAASLVSSAYSHCNHHVLKSCLVLPLRTQPPDTKTSKEYWLLLSCRA